MTTAKPPKPAVHDTRKTDVNHLAEKTMQLLQKESIAPTPDNYSLWFHYIQNDIPELTKEVERLKGQKVKFKSDVLHYLFEKYIVKHKKQAENTIAENAAKAMTRVMDMVVQFSGETESYNKKLDRQTESIAQHVSGNAVLEDLLGEIVQQLREVQQNSESFSKNLTESHAEIQSLKESLDKAADEARRDFLTGIDNRRAFDEAIEELVEDSKDKEKDLCLLLVDIDHFKQFNDTYGHQIGDEVLKIVARALTRSVRGQDVVARYGGEEFAVLLPETPINGAHIVAENIRKLIADNRLKRKNSTEDLGQITVSIGATRFRFGMHENDNVPYFIQRADEALYKAKKAGRNKVILEL